VVGWNPPLLGNGRCNLAQTELDDPVGQQTGLRKQRVLGHNLFQGGLTDLALSCAPPWKRMPQPAAARRIDPRTGRPAAGAPRTLRGGGRPAPMPC
jgi:hypothetical protein